MKGNFGSRNSEEKQKVERVVLKDEDLPEVEPDFFDAADEAYKEEAEKDL